MDEHSASANSPSETAQLAAAPAPASKLKFNVNAPAFKPSFNVNAPVFKPKAAAPATAAPEEPKATEEEAAPVSSSTTTTTATPEPAAAATVTTPVAAEPEEPAHGEEEGEEASAVPETTSDAPRKVIDPRDHLSIVLIGHVDAGKSTTAGNLLFLTGQVDQRTIEKYEKEAKEKAGGSWYLAFIMDTNEDERAKGKTVEVGRAHFTTETRRFTILDAPGHKNYVPNMIGGAACADVGILVISARINEFEAGFDKGGQTREHTMLAKTLGVSRLVVVINKMDDKSVMWSKERYDSILQKLQPFLKQVGFGPKDVSMLPISGITGANLLQPLDASVCDWYQGPSLVQVLDGLRPPKRDPAAALRIPILDRIKDAGKVFIEGKVESGTVRVGQKVVVMPTKQAGVVLSVASDFAPDLDGAAAGEYVRIVVSGVSDDQIRAGFVVCDAEHPIVAVPQFEAQLAVIDLLEHKPIISPGYTAVFHAHTAVEECTIKLILGTIDKKTGEVSKQKPKFVKKGAFVSARIQLTQPVCLDTYKDFPQLGRFTLRDEGKTIAIGKVTRLPGARPGAK